MQTTAFSSCAPIGMHCDGTSITLAGRSDAMHVAYHEVSPKYFARSRRPSFEGASSKHGRRRHRAGDGHQSFGGAAHLGIRRSFHHACRLRRQDSSRDRHRRRRALRGCGARTWSRPFSFRRFPTPRSRGVLFVRTSAPGRVAPADIRLAVRRAGAATRWVTSARSRADCAMRCRAAD